MFCFGAFRFNNGANAKGQNILTKFKKASFEKFLKPNERYKLLQIDTMKCRDTFQNSELSNDGYNSSENIDFDFGPIVTMTANDTVLENLYSEQSDASLEDSVLNNVYPFENSAIRIENSISENLTTADSSANIILSSIQENQSTSFLDTTSESDFEDRESESEIQDSNLVSLNVNVLMQHLDNEIVENSRGTNSLENENDDKSVEKYVTSIGIAKIDRNSRQGFLELMKGVDIVHENIEIVKKLQLTCEFVDSMSDNELAVSLKELSSLSSNTCRIISRAIKYAVADSS